MPEVRFAVAASGIKAKVNASSTAAAHVRRRNMFKRSQTVNQREKFSPTMNGRHDEQRRADRAPLNIHTPPFPADAQRGWIPPMKMYLYVAPFFGAYPTRRDRYSRFE
jgi:hypothetical protein